MIYKNYWIVSLNNIFRNLCYHIRIELWWINYLTPFPLRHTLLQFLSLFLKIYPLVVRNNPGKIVYNPKIKMCFTLTVYFPGLAVIEIYLGPFLRSPQQLQYLVSSYWLPTSSSYKFLFDPILWSSIFCNTYGSDNGPLININLSKYLNLAFPFFS